MLTTSFSVVFRYRQDAVFFETLRQKHGTDEIKAWVEYTKYKSSMKERREVIECNQFDLIEGSSRGRWKPGEYKKWLHGLLKFGKNYRKIAEYVGSRDYSQIKTFGKKYFGSGGKIPKSEGDIYKMIAKAEEERNSNTMIDCGADVTKGDATLARPDDKVAAVKCDESGHKSTTRRALRGDGHSSRSSTIKSSATKRKADAVEKTKGATSTKRQKHGQTQMGLNTCRAHRRIQRDVYIGPGWEIDLYDKSIGKRTRWISPTRKMRFR